jgi:hypothetical protein
VTAVSLPYLGLPGAMRALPSPNSPVTAAPSRGDVVHGLLSGGTAVHSRLHAKKAYSLSYTMLPASDADILLGFYQRLFGLGPFVFVDPSARNVLGLDVSTVGARPQAALGWVASAGSLGRASGAPSGCTASGVLTWSSLASAATLNPGSLAGSVSATAAPVYLPSEAVTVSMWVKASASAAMTLRLAGFNAAGTLTVSSVSTAVAATTSWQRFAVTAAVGNAALAAAAFVAPQLLLGSSVPASVSIAGVQLEYGDTATAWQPGFGSPRVLPTSSPGRESSRSSTSH